MCYYFMAHMLGVWYPRFRPIKLFSRCTSKPDTHFVSEKGINNCVIEKILRNKFHDPLLSSDNSDSDDESQRLKIDWDEVFKKKDNVSMTIFFFSMCVYRIRIIHVSNPLSTFLLKHLTQHSNFDIPTDLKQIK